MGVCCSTDKSREFAYGFEDTSMKSGPAVDPIEDELNRSIHNPNKTHRQRMAWHREGVSVSEVYDVLKVVGEGSMGEVTIVQKKEDTTRKLERRFSENSTHGSSRSLDELVEKQMASGTLKMDMNKKQSNSRRKYACKTVNTLSMKDDELIEFMNEIEILRDLDHPNIVQLFEVFKLKRKLWIITELCAGGDLTARAGDMSELEAAIVMEQILRAISFMHKRNICHRDIKLENVMFSDDKADAVVKLIDFGLSNKFKKGETMEKACGTVYTAAPELLLGKGSTEQTDIWSVGCVAYILLSHTYPFLVDWDDMSDQARMLNFTNGWCSFGDAWKERGISKFGRSFCIRSFIKHPWDRWTANDALHFVQNQWIPYLEQIEFEGGNPHDSFVDDRGFNEADQPSPRKVDALVKRSVLDLQMINGMDKFTRHGDFKKTILMTMAYTMDKSSVKELNEAFNALDSSGYGVVTPKDMIVVLKEKHGLDDEWIEKLFYGIDRYRTGQIQYNEFLGAVMESQGIITPEHLADAFDRLDADQKGYISKEDLRNILGPSSNHDEVQRMFEEADHDGDGEVNYEEFLQVMFSDPDKMETHDKPGTDVDVQ